MPIIPSLIHLRTVGYSYCDSWIYRCWMWSICLAVQLPLVVFNAVRWMSVVVFDAILSRMVSRNKRERQMMMIWRSFLRYVWYYMMRDVSMVSQVFLVVVSPRWCCCCCCPIIALYVDQLSRRICSSSSKKYNRKIKDHFYYLCTRRFDGDLDRVSSLVNSLTVNFSPLLSRWQQFNSPLHSLVRPAVCWVAWRQTTPFVRCELYRVFFFLFLFGNNNICSARLQYYT